LAKRLSEAFRQNLPFLQRLIEQNALHASDGPVNLSGVVHYLGYDVRYFNKPYWKKVKGWAFYARGRAGMFINQAHPPEIQRETVAHELIHLLEHTQGQAHQSFEGEFHTVEEHEAYLLVPLGYLAECLSQGMTAAEIAVELQVPPELVKLRFAMALELNELALEDGEHR
jgi:Zn-dependent peptidase ImmA (M78 family)